MELTREEKIVVAVSILSVLEREGAFDKLNIVEEVLASDSLGYTFINSAGDVTGGSTEVALDKMTKVCCKILESLKGENN